MVNEEDFWFILSFWCNTPLAMEQPYALQLGVERELLERWELRKDYIHGGPVEVSRTRYTFDGYVFG